MSAMPVLLAILCLMAIAYRYYSAFLAAKVATLDDRRLTPAEKINDGQNYHPTGRWVLFGHHFAAISGAGPLIGPVLAAQFGYLPGLLWIVIGVCLAGAVQDFLVLAASIRRGGKSLAQIAYDEIGAVAGSAAMIAILFIIVIALAGLGAVVVKALGGDAVKYPADSRLVLPQGTSLRPTSSSDGNPHYIVPAGSKLFWARGKQSMLLDGAFEMEVVPTAISPQASISTSKKITAAVPQAGGEEIPWPAGGRRLVPGSAWGTFTIACTIPIALFIGLYMYKLRPGKVFEASVIGGVLVLAATAAGGWISHHAIASVFTLSGTAVVWTMALYGFVAAVLPVWVLLTPRDYLSSFLKIGTIALLVGGVLLANPKLEAPAVNHEFLSGGPTVSGNIFPFLFITIMCGAISGFHALVASGTTPKMIRRESDARMIGYGAMLMEALVGVVAMIAAASLTPGDYYAMNTELASVPAWHDHLVNIGAGIDHLNGPGGYDYLTQESLRGRTGGAVTLAVGMAHIFDTALGRVSASAKWLWKYWYHFAIMFEALFILTTIDAGTRIGRFLVQELMGRVHPKLGRTDWWPGAIFATALIVGGWSYFILHTDTFNAIWGMFGIANQMLAVIALTVVSAVLVNEGKARYLLITLLPMLVVLSTTSAAAGEMLGGLLTTLQTQAAKPGGALFSSNTFDSWVRLVLIMAMLLCTYLIILAAACRAWPRLVRVPLAPGGAEGH